MRLSEMMEAHRRNCNRLDDEQFDEAKRLHVQLRRVLRSKLDDTGTSCDGIRAAVDEYRKKSTANDTQYFVKLNDLKNDLISDLRSELGLGRVLAQGDHRYG
jgi:hypothetical protein